MNANLYLLTSSCLCILIVIQKKQHTVDVRMKEKNMLTNNGFLRSAWQSIRNYKQSEIYIRFTLTIRLSI